jgi:hypothetical protein
LDLAQPPLSRRREPAPPNNITDVYLSVFNKNLQIEQSNRQ